MQLTFDADVEAFRADFIAFLDEYLPDPAVTEQRSRSTADIPDWARAWQRAMFDHGWLLPGNPPEFGGRNASILQQYVHRDELSKRRIYQSFNPQGLGIIAASLLSFGTDEQKQRWAVPILRAEITAALGMSEPGAGSDLASLRTSAVLEDDHFIVNGQKVWTSGAHHADVILTFVRTDPDAPKHKGISVLVIPTDTPGVVRRPFASICGHDDLDFNEVFFTDVRVPAENLLGERGRGFANFLAPLAMGAQSPPEATAELEAGLCALDPRIARRFARLVFLVDCREQLPRVAVPSLILQCLHDSIAPREVGQFMHRAMPRSTLVELDAAGHLPHVTHPEHTTRILRQYLDETAAHA